MTRHTLRHYLTHFAQTRIPRQKDRLQFIVLVMSTAMYLVGLTLHFFLYVGVGAAPMQAVSAAFWLFSAAVLAVALSGRVRPEPLMSWYGIVAQIVQSARIVYLAVARPEGYADALMLNEVVALTVIIFQVIAFTRYTPAVVTALNLATLCVALPLAPPDAMPRQLAILFAFEELSICVLGYFTQRFVFSIERDNDDYMRTQQGILSAFGMTRQELVAYLQLCRSADPQHEELSAFFSQLGEQAEQNLIRAVERRKAELMAEREAFAARCPGLTPTELEVCRLVVAGKTLGEIARITGKSTNNISSVRIHIRRKLALQPSDDLRTALCGMKSK